MLIICPGVHPEWWTHCFVQQLDAQLPEARLMRLIMPATTGRPWSPYALRVWLQEQAIAPMTPLVFIAFSAGCVAATSLIWHRHQQGHPVLAAIAVDGWGVPLVLPCASYRLSHDAFTHHTSIATERHQPSFYADPPVSHQQLWCNPAHVQGRQAGTAIPLNLAAAGQITALGFLVACLRLYPQAWVEDRSRPHTEER